MSPHGRIRWSARAGWLIGVGLLTASYCLAPTAGIHDAVADDPAPAEPAAVEAEPPQEPEPAAAPAQPQLPAAVEVELDTSDGVVLTIWHYPGNASNTEGGGVSVMLLHDFGSSHKGVEPLAKALQSLGCDVVVPDLRGHGASRTRRVGDRESKVEAKALKATEVEFMAHSRGSQVRDQAAHRGDVETTRNWMISQGLPIDRLHVAGVGLGAAVAAAWTAEDANWPSLASGPQGGQVRGLVMIAPLLAPRGLSLLKPLEQEALKKSIPVLILGGKNDKDADRVFDQLKRQRPQTWFKRPAVGKVERAEKLDDSSKATLFQIEFDSTAEGEKLAATPGVAEAIERFLSLTKPTQKPRR